MNVNELLENWWKYREIKLEAEKKLEKYKKKIEKIMERENSNKIQSGKYVVSKRKTHTTRLSKQNVPKDIWERYSTTTAYNTFTIKEVKKKK
tara:strand:- start:161 stop:436 length:276 start_codon:yes stop_codon:yes gene_type:complete